MDGMSPKNPSDGRLVLVQLHQPFALFPFAPSIPDLDEKLESVNGGAQAWFDYWNDYYEALGVAKGSFLREACDVYLCCRSSPADGMYQ